MKKIIIVILAFSTIIIASCTKDTKVTSTGTVRYTNNSNGGNRYEVFLDGASLGLLNADTFLDKNAIPIGSHIVRAKQNDGVILIPIQVEKTVTVSKGLITEFIFP
jgi:hypothetical protein